MRFLLNKLSPPPLNQGQLAEQHAFDFLSQQGLTGVTRNFRGPRGEIDLIMIDGDILVFIEVRYRKKNKHGSALESVNSQKIKKLRLTAQSYLQQHKEYADYPCRFDVIGWQNGHAEWIKNAFY